MRTTIYHWLANVLGFRFGIDENQAVTGHESEAISTSSRNRQDDSSQQLIHDIQSLLPGFHHGHARLNNLYSIVDRELSDLLIHQKSTLVSPDYVRQKYRDLENMLLDFGCEFDRLKTDTRVAWIHLNEVSDSIADSSVRSELASLRQRVEYLQFQYDLLSNKVRIHQLNAQLTNGQKAPGFDQGSFQVAADSLTQAIQAIEQLHICTGVLKRRKKVGVPAVI